MNINKDTIYYNCLIAAFMGYERKESNWNFFQLKHYYIPEFGYFMDYDLKYHLSWDWLMPVVDKIERDYMATISIHCCVVNVNINGIPEIIYNCPPATLGVNAKDKINATWMAVVDFIKYYNTLKPIDK